MFHRALIAFLVALFLPVAVNAQSRNEREALRLEAQRLEENAEYEWKREGMAVVEPERGRDRVGPIKPNWCDLVEPEPKPWKGKTAKRLSRMIKHGTESTEWDRVGPYVFSALCAFPDDPGYQEQAGYLVQYYVNRNGQSKEEALKWMRLRADKEAWAKHNAPPVGQYPGELMVVEPEPGRVDVGSVKPTWCDKVEMDRTSKEPRIAGRIDRTLSTSARNWFSPSDIESLLVYFCSFPDHPGFHKQAGAMVQLWVNHTGQSKEDAIASLVARADDDRWYEAREAGCNKIKASEEASYEEEQLVRGRKRLFCSKPQDYYVFRGEIWGEYEWFMDRTDQPPSELERLINTLSCLPPGGRDMNRDDWVRIGLCGHDVKALDRKKIEAETAQMPMPFKMIALESLSTAKAVYADLELMAQEKVESDRDYKRLLYDAPKAGWDAWMKKYMKHKSGFEATFRFEKALSAPRKSAVEGCWQYLEPEMKKYVKSSKFTKREQFMEAMRGPVGQVLMNALGACYAVSAPASVGKLFLDINKQARSWRGPRAAVRYAMLDTMSEIRADRDRFSIRFGFLEDRLPNLVREVAMSEKRSKIPNTGGKYNDSVRGIVKTFKKAQGKKEAHKANFKTESWVEKKTICTETNKVDYIKGGKIYYRHTCRPGGNVKQTFTPNETFLYSWSTSGIKPNALVIMAVPAVSKYAKRSRWGFPIEVYSNKNKKKLVNMYGFKL